VEEETQPTWIRYSFGRQGRTGKDLEPSSEENRSQGKGAGYPGVGEAELRSNSDFSKKKKKKRLARVKENSGTKKGESENFPKKAVRRFKG